MRRKLKNWSWFKAGIMTGVAVVAVIIVVGLISSFGQRVWGGNEPVVIVLAQSKQVLIIRWQPQDKNLLVVGLPDDLYLPLAQGYGIYKAGSVVGLDKQEKKWGELVRLGIQEGLGIGVDGFMVSYEEGGEVNSQSGNSLRWELIKNLWRQLTNKGVTNLTIWDMGRLWWAWGGVGGGVQQLDLTNGGGVKTTYLPDGSRVSEIDQAAMDKWVGKVFKQDVLRQESLRVAVVNATNVVGLAGTVARLATNQGVVVVNLTDADKRVQKSMIKVSQEKLKSAVTVRKLARWLAIDQVVVENTNDQRAQVVVVIGEDYWDRVFKPVSETLGEENEGV